jgi:hypothetical protein
MFLEEPRGLGFSLIETQVDVDTQVQTQCA